MFRYALIVMLFSASVLSAQVTSNWTGSGDGFDYFDPLNWDNGVPGFGDTAKFGQVADGSNIDFSTNDIVVDNLEISTLGLDGGVSLVGDNGIFIGNFANFNGGSIVSLAGNALVEIDPAANFEIYGSDEFRLEGRDVQNYGEIGFFGTNQITLTNTTIYNFGQIIISNTTNGFNSGGGVVNNSGNFIREATPGSANIGWDIYNDGIVGASQGSLRFAGPYQQDSGDTVVDNGAEIEFAGNTVFNGGSIIGEGVIRNSTLSAIDVMATFIDAVGNPEQVIVDGDPPTPATLQFAGDFTFDSNSIFFFDIVGPNAGEYDQIEFISGLADLNPGPDIVVFGDPSIKSTVGSSDVFDILVGNYSGNFALLSEGSQITVFNSDPLGFPILGTFDILYGSGVIQLTNFVPVPEPQTWALIGLGAALIGLWARRRVKR